MSADGNRPRILVLDDEPMVGELLSRVLADEMDVDTERHAPKGLERMLASPTYDLILCDLAMPVLSGQALFEQLEDDHPEIAERLMFITGGAFDDEVTEFLDNVDNPVLHKPFTADELRAAVRAALDALGRDR